MSSLSALELDPGFTHNLRGMGLGDPDSFSLGEIFLVTQEGQGT